MTSRRLMLPGCLTGFFLFLATLGFLVLNEKVSPLVHGPAVPLPGRERTLYNEAACSPYTASSEAPTIIANETSSFGPFQRRKIAIGSVFPHHFDVYMAVVWTLERTLSTVDGSQIRVFAEPFNYGFQSVIDRLGLYHGIRNSSDELLPFLDSEEGYEVDMVILGTCEVDLRTWHADLLAIWDNRPYSRKFQLVCIVHNVKDVHWQGHITEWSRRGAIRLLPIAEHVKIAFQRVFNQHADSADVTLYTAGYENIPVDVHVPVLDLPLLPDKDRTRTLSKAVIQGTFNPDRRDYSGFFSDIVKSLHDDPASWGYHPPGSYKAFIPDHRSHVRPFEIALIGAGTIEIPEELAYMVTVYHDLDYEDFYKLVADMDIIVPAFAEFGYYEDQASSTIALAVELDVPILATARMRKAYGYIDDDRVVVTRPAAMREVHALNALRTRNASAFLESDLTGTGYKMSEIRGLESAVHRMLETGWIREKQETAELKKELWRHNDVVIQQLLSDG